MKTLRFLIPLLLAATPLALAQNDEESATGISVDKMLPNQRAFLNLPQEQREEFIKLYRETSRLISQQRILEALDSAIQATKVFEDSPEIHNMIGSCYVEIRSFDKALESFKTALELTANRDSILFNIGEVYFVTKQWEKSIATFEELLKLLPENKEFSLGRLAEFKILLCKLKLGETEEATVLANKYDFLDDSPFHYFAMAALSYENGDMVEAERSIGRAGRIFRNPAILSSWHDTMVEYGYIKSFYGGDHESVTP